jgi:hypothetical protein
MKKEKTIINPISVSLSKIKLNIFKIKINFLIYKKQHIF